MRKIEYMEKIAQILAESRNKVMLNNDVLNMNLPTTTQAEYAKSKWSEADLIWFIKFPK